MVNRTKSFSSSTVITLSSTRDSLIVLLPKPGYIFIKIPQICTATPVKRCQNELSYVYVSSHCLERLVFSRSVFARNFWGP